jgi:hypothetical protein
LEEALELVMVHGARHGSPLRNRAESRRGVNHRLLRPPARATAVAAPGRGAIVQRMKVKGTVRYSDLEGGQWTLEVEGGDRYQLVGSGFSPKSVKDGNKVEVEGNVEKDAMGIGMTGPQLNVKNIRVL